MSIYSTRAYQTAGSTLFRNKTPVAQMTGIDGIGSGSRNEIDITQLHSVNTRETILGYLDAGNITGSGILVPGEITHAQLEVDAGSTDIGIFHILLPVNFDDATGVGSLSQKEIGTFDGENTAAAIGAECTITASTAGEWKILPGFGSGDYVEVAAGKFVKVTSVEISNADKLIVKGTAVTVVGQGNNITAKMLRVPARYSFNAQVSNFTKNFASEDAARFDLDLRVSGQVTLTLGTPALAAL